MKQIRIGTGPSLIGALGRACYRHRWITLFVWLAGAASLTTLWTSFVELSRWRRPTHSWRRWLRGGPGSATTNCLRCCCGSGGAVPGLAEMAALGQGFCWARVWVLRRVAGRLVWPCGRAG